MKGSPVLLGLLISTLSYVEGRQHMNVDQMYRISNPPPGLENKSYSFHGEYFEVETAPLKMKYAEVFWRSMGDPVPLPDDIVKRFMNSSIGISGFEVDVLRYNNETGKTESVPAYQSYNHHYSPCILSNFSQLKLDANGYPTGPDHGHGKMIEIEFRDGVDPALIPANARLAQSFVHGNGQEHRQIYHGAPNGYVQDIYSPASFVLFPMQISTNDGTNALGPHGPISKFSQDTAPPDMERSYSPLLECPCTDRITKKLGQISSVVSGTCAIAIPLANDCFTAAATTLGVAAVVANTSLSSYALPSGCSISRAAAGSKTFYVNYNSNSSSTAQCQGPSTPHKSGHLSGTQTDLVTIQLDISDVTSLASMTLSGPSDVWFGVGFNASTMGDLPYAVIVDGQGNVQERKMGDHVIGTALSSSVTISSNTVLDGIRTVKLTRPLEGLTSDHYTFDTSRGSINFINAIGGIPQFVSQHTKRAAATLILLQADTTPTCLCSAGVGAINGIPFNGGCTGIFEPLSDLLEENNPTCQVSTYVGGLSCCVDGQVLLDADQNTPDFVDEVYFKFRFYYEPYDPTVHQLINHVEWAINGCNSGCGGPTPMGCHHIEFDVVKGQGSALGPDVQIVQSTSPAGGMLCTSCTPSTAQCFDGSKVDDAKGFKLVMAAIHCHAPNCIRQQLINVDTGEVICDATPVHGTSELAMDEKDYLYSKPCTWGSPEEGLLPPPVLYKNTTMQMIGFYNSTYGHPGQMGIWQMKAAYVE